MLLLLLLCVIIIICYYYVLLLLFVIIICYYYYSYNNNNFFLLQLYGEYMVIFFCSAFRVCDQLAADGPWPHYPCRWSDRSVVRIARAAVLGQWLESHKANQSGHGHMGTNVPPERSSKSFGPGSSRRSRGKICTAHIGCHWQPSGYEFWHKLYGRCLLGLSQWGRWQVEANHVVQIRLGLVAPGHGNTKVS